MAALTAAALAFCYRQERKRALAAVLLPMALFQIGFSGMLLPALKISPGSDREWMGFFYQQTARYVRDYPDEVTVQEWEAIDGVLEYDKLAEAYNPITSDPVKFDAYRSEQTWKERKAYFKAWFQQFLKHPGVYVEASN